MPFDPLDFVALADTLIEQHAALGPEEACLRSAVSRAYYGVFLMARNILTDRYQAHLPGSGADHGLVIRHLQTSADVACRQLAILVGRLRDNRRLADYARSLPIPPLELAKRSERLAEHARQLLARI